MTAERDVKTSIMLALGARPDVRLFLNPVGAAWVGDSWKMGGGGRDILIIGARRVTYGLAPGSHDIIGWRSRIIRPEDVGTRLAQFLSIDAKRSRGGVVSDEQGAFARAVASAGGLVGICPSVESAVALVDT